MKIKKASSFFFWLLRRTLGPIIRFKYGFKFDRKHSKPINSAKLKRPCVILSNHQTAADPFTVTQGFRFGINYLANGAAFKKGFGSKLIAKLTRLIPISKGTADAGAVRKIFSCVKNGGAVAIFPSGNTSWFGDECEINPSIAKLCKKLGVPVVLVRQEGGFMTRPRWRPKNAVSRGKFRASVTRVIEPAELATLSDEEIFTIIQSEICHDEFAWNRVAKIKFKGKRKAEYLESALFYCPQCQSYDKLKSEGNDFFCTGCGARVTINPYGFFDTVSTGTVSQAPLPESILEWGKLQETHIKLIDYDPYAEIPLFCDDGVKLKRMQNDDTEEPLGSGTLALYRDRITACGHSFPFDSVQSMAIALVSILNLYTADGSYSINVPPRTNVYKYFACGNLLKSAIGNLKTSND